MRFTSTLRSIWRFVSVEIVRSLSRVDILTPQPDPRPNPRPWLHLAPHCLILGHLFLSLRSRDFKSTTLVIARLSSEKNYVNFPVLYILCTYLDTIFEASFHSGFSEYNFRVCDFAGDFFLSARLPRGRPAVTDLAASRRSKSGASIVPSAMPRDRMSQLLHSISSGTAVRIIPIARLCWHNNSVCHASYALHIAWCERSPAHRRRAQARCRIKLPHYYSRRKDSSGRRASFPPQWRCLAISARISRYRNRCELKSNTRRLPRAHARNRFRMWKSFAR